MMAQAFITRRKGGGGVNKDLPAQVTAFTATADSTPSITLNWVNPTEYWAGTLIVKKAGSAPEGVNDGEKVYKGEETSYTDFDVSFDTEYFYRAFPYNEKKQYQTLIVTANATPTKEIIAPLYTGDYTVAEVGEYVYMHLLTSGTLTIQQDAEYDLFCVGGGGGGVGSSNYHYGAGAGGYTATAKGIELNADDVINVTIGSGGLSGSSKGGAGGTTSFAGATKLAAEGGTNARRVNYTYAGHNGGSGGGAGYRSPYTGGEDGSNGKNTTYGGKGQGSTTRAFAETDGTLYASGGSGAPETAGRAAGISAGAGFGITVNSGSTSAGNATANTGSGGGSAYNRDSEDGSATGGSGGSGIAIIRWKKAA